MHDRLEVSSIITILAQHYRPGVATPLYVGCIFKYIVRIMVFCHNLGIGHSKATCFEVTDDCEAYWRVDLIFTDPQLLEYSFSSCLVTTVSLFASY